MATKFLVINQHGDNRGDEAALRGMVTALRERVSASRFTVIHQFASPESAIELPDVSYLPLRIPIHEAICLSVWAALKRVGLRSDFLLGGSGKQIVAAYREADVVISAPGGPYFGDLYANHEIVHWFYTWMARLHALPLFLYQPSSGPFQNRLLNPIRRRGFRWFDVITVREEISAGYIEEFTGQRPFVGSDSALQERVPPVDPSTYLGSRPTEDVESGLVTGTFRDPGIVLREIHDGAIVEALVRVSDTGRSVLLLPQLHGPRHQDQPYLDSLAQQARHRGASVSVAPDSLTSVEQRGLVAASDLVLAGRYHPLVFAVSAGVPALTIPYEHKARGVAEAAGLGDYIVELEDLDDEVLVARIDTLLERLDDVRNEVKRREPALRRSAAATSDLVTTLVQSRPARI